MFDLGRLIVVVLHKRFDSQGLAGIDVTEKMGDFLLLLKIDLLILAG